MGRRLFFSLMLFLALVLNASAAERLQERMLPMPDRGMLVLLTPAAWSQQIEYPPDVIAPTIRFSGTAGQKFEVVITAFWSPKTDPSFNSPANVRSIVTETLVDLRPRLVEKNIPILGLTVGSRTGYYASATVKALGPDEHKFLTQGAIGGDDLLLTFTLLANEKPSPIINQTLDMLHCAKRGT